MKTKNFSEKSASVIGRYAKKEFTCFSEYVRVVRRMFESYEIAPESLQAELAQSIADAVTAGVNYKTDANITYIVEKLTGSQWVENGKLLERKAGELVPVERWTPTKVIAYMRRANRAHLDSLGIK